MNLLSCGSENWSGNRYGIRKCEAFHHKTMRKIMGSNMLQVKEDIRNSDVRKKFLDIQTFDEI